MQTLILKALTSSLVLGGLLTAGCGEFPPNVPTLPAVKGDPFRAPSSISVQPLDNGRFSCTFQLAGDSAGEAKSMTLAGDFNGWNPGANPMKLVDGRWEATIELAEGVRYYKFVADGSRWMPDPANTDRVPDGHGGDNTILRLGSTACLDPTSARPDDGRIATAGVRHDPESFQHLQILPDGSIQVVLETLRNDVELVTLVGSDGVESPMQIGWGGDGFDAWNTTLDAGRTGIEYTFILQDGNSRFRDPETYTMAPSQQDTFSTPDWAKEATWYQVMVERFRDGDPGNNPDPMRPWKSEWYSSSPWEGQDGQSFYEYFVFDRHYGGDLQGLRQQLPYLKDLGVNALYLNPVFQADTHHKYNATDFRHIDETYGAGNGDYERTASQEDLLDPSTWIWSESDLIFLDFLKEAKAQGFRVIIDGVFNHVGKAHPAFMDVQERGVESPYADWFAITSWEPFDWEGWAGFKDLPVFRKSAEHGLAAKTVRDHIFNVTRRWMDPDGDGDPSDGIDGWRLDVPNEVPFPFWVEWRELVKSINPDAYITGEIWNRAEEWLDGRTFDAVMNYQFAEPALAWIGNKDKRIPPSEVDRQLANLRNAYPAEATFVLQNLADSHDTDRLVSKIFNPDRPYDSQNREQDDPTYVGDKPDEASYRKARLVAFLQMTYVGAPMVYYGDEVGMWGSDDPNNRKPMLWKDLEPYEDAEQNHVMDDHLQYYKQVIALRNAHSALRNGAINTVLTDDDRNLWVFIRENGEEQVLVAINAGDEDADLELIDLGEGWSPAFGEGSDNPPNVNLPAWSGRAWTRSR